MPALIQKLFGRKKTSAPKPIEPAGPTANQQEKSDRQDELRQQQLARVSASAPQSELESLATGGVTADIRLSAAKLLTGKDRLQRVQKQAKGKDKGVYQSVRQALQAIRAREEEQQQQEQAIQTLLQNAIDQSRSNDTKLFEPRLEALLKRWSTLENHATEQQAHDFLQAVHECRARLEVMNAEKAREAQVLEQKSQRKETLSLLEETVRNLKHPSPDSEPSVASLDALQKTQENRWLEATRDTTVDKQEQKTYESLMLPLRAYISALKRFGQNRDAVQALVEHQSHAALQGDQQTADGQQPNAGELLATIEWPAEFPMPPQLQELARTAGQTPATEPLKDSAARDTDQQALAEKIRETLARLEQALESSQLKESRQLFRTAQQQFKQLDRRHGQPLQPRLQLLGGQVRELADWQGFATRPKQIALCEQMEYLADQPMEPEAKAERIKEIQNEWRALGGSSDRELWTRFKQASDQAYEPCKAYFSAKSGLKQANLETRKAIVEQLKTFVDNADWQSIDWKAAERIHQKAREEWKAAWPIEFRDNRSVQKDFDRLLRQLEEPLNEQRINNESRKKAIVEKAEALIDHEPLAEAMNQAKALQGEWQQVGITRHREDRKLWQAFREACDQIFARRDVARNEQQELTREADEKAEALLTDSALQDASTPEEVLAEHLATLHSFETESLSNPRLKQLKQEQARLRSLLDAQQSRETLKQWQRNIQIRADGALEASELPRNWQELAGELDVADAAELVLRAEILARIPSPADEQARRMEIQVRRLADGMGGNGKYRDVLAEMESLVAGWCLSPNDDAITQTGADRLMAALAAAFRQMD